MSKRIDRPLSTKGYAFVGVWRDKTIGWHGIGHIHSMDKASPPSDNWLHYSRKGDRAYLCEVIITPIIDSKGRPITRVKK